MSVEALLEQARSLITNHNTNLTPSNAGEGILPDGHVNPNDFITNLKIFGSHTEEALKGMSYEEILECMKVTGTMKPKGLAKSIAKIFRGKEELPARPSYISQRMLEQLTIRELISRYNVKDTAVRTRTCLIAKRLDEISKGQPFLVFPDDSGRADADFSASLLEELVTGQSPIEEITYNGDVKHIFKVYEQLGNYVPENPLYPGRPLRVGETCDQTLRSWAGVGKPIRQFVYMAVKSGDLLVNIDHAHAILDIAIGTNAMKTLRQRFPKVSVKFDAAQQIDNLPKLLLELSQSTGNPFVGGRKVQ